jgi:hypothetical protein
MSGAASAGGLLYQESYLTFRVVSGLARQITDSGSSRTSISEFSIEGRSGGNAPVWDIWIRYANGALDFVECKNTAIEADDRRIFYARLRYEVASGTDAARIQPVWVTDPGKQNPDALQHLDGIAAEAESFTFESIPSSWSKRVDCARHALEEAVFCLCHDSKLDAKARRCTEAEARVLLRNTRVERHRLEELQCSVSLVITGVLTRGTGAALSDYVTGVLTREIGTTKRAQFTVGQLLEKVGTTAIGVEVEGRFRALLSFNAASGFVNSPRLIKWSCLPETPTTRWELAERLPAYKGGASCVVVAGMGLGKTVASFQALVEEARRRDPSRVIRVEARILDAEELDALVRLAWMLSGSGPIWLAVDGLDEVSVGLLPRWAGAIQALQAIPNAALFVTVRREVLAVREELAEMTSALESVRLVPLSDAQVERAFSDVGLPVPSNRLLVGALQNPFLLSLYADIVSPGDMPLAESGEVTAFRVIDEFWKRRVRGLSIGLRAVGNSETSQEPKRLAAVFLSERSLAGESAIGRTSEDALIAHGIEMLLREGVLREQGAGAVAWVHEWLREYAIVDRLLVDLGELTAANLARAVTRCGSQPVSRVAAAGGAKWVAAHPECGSGAEYLVELWAVDKRLAREALVVLLEGPSSGLQFAALPPGLLYEAITLAVHLRAEQWADQTASLSNQCFLEKDSNELHAIAVQHELADTKSTDAEAKDTVKRLVARDLERLRAGLATYRGTLRLLIEHIKKTKLYCDPVCCEWLELLSTVTDEIDRLELLKLVSTMIGEECVSAAHTVFRAITGFANARRNEIFAEQLVNRQSLLSTELRELLKTPAIVSHQYPEWGKTLVELLAVLIRARQKSFWPQKTQLTAAISEALGAGFEASNEYEPNFDEDPRLSCRPDPGRRNPIVDVLATLEKQFRELAGLDDAEPFGQLAGHAISVRFAGVAVVPLLALLDAVVGSTAEEWHKTLAVTLLKREDVSRLQSLSDVRRLLVRQLVNRLDQSQLIELAESIRQSMLPDGLRVAELSELRDAGVLTAVEQCQVDEAIERHELREAMDPRQNPLWSDVHWEYSEAPEPISTGWPYPEDERHVAFLMRALPETDRKDAPKRSEWLAGQLEALDVVLCRDEATTEKWLGTSLGWCRSAIEELRASTARSSDDEEHAKLTGAIWAEALETNARWWRHIVDKAIERLGGSVPSGHNDDRPGPFLSYLSDDVFYNALELLDELLAMERVAPFADYQQRFADIVAASWRCWPAYTKATALNSIRAWFWLNFDNLRTVLAEAVRADARPLVVNNALRRSTYLAHFAAVPELRDFLARTDVGRFEDGIRYVAELLGQAAMVVGLENGGSKQLATDVHTLFGEAIGRADIDGDVVNRILTGMLWGAAQYALNCESISPALAESWLRTVNDVISKWRFDRSQKDDGTLFPIHAMSNMLDSKSSPEVLQMLVEGTSRAFECLVRQGSLTDFFSIHHILSSTISGRAKSVSVSACTRKILLSKPLEEILLSLCQASVDRVCKWKQEGKTTEDLGWGKALNGSDSVELIKIVIDATPDQNQLAVQLMPLADLLADAGLQGIAADLRTHLRKAR